MAQGLSVNANVGAMVALQQLNLTNKKMRSSQLRITTGLRVNGPKDNGSTFAIATRLRGDIAGTESVKVALASSSSVVDVAISAGKAIADVLVEMKGKTVQANQAGLTAASRSSLQTDFTALLGLMGDNVVIFEQVPAGLDHYELMEAISKARSI